VLVVDPLGLLVLNLDLFFFFENAEFNVTTRGGRFVQIADPGAVKVKKMHLPFCPVHWTWRCDLSKFLQTMAAHGCSDLILLLLFPLVCEVDSAALMQELMLAAELRALATRPLVAAVLAGTVPQDDEAEVSLRVLEHAEATVDAALRRLCENGTRDSRALAQALRQLLSGESPTALAVFAL
jgi:hypothetical protein